VAGRREDGGLFTGNHNKEKYQKGIMKMGHRYQDVEEMIKGLSEDDKFKKSCLANMDANIMNKFLFIAKQKSRVGKISRFDILVYHLFHWRWNRRLAEDKCLRNIFHEWLHGFEKTNS